VIEYTIACALALSPPGMRAALRAYIAKEASAQVRLIFGGDRAYISRRKGEGTSLRNAAIKRDYWQGGEHIALMERRYGLSSAHLWRIIKS
jgi:Mor family transcriptional regulator